VLRRDESLADEFMSSQHIGIDRRRVSCGEHQLACGEPQRWAALIKAANIKAE